MNSPEKLIINRDNLRDLFGFISIKKMTKTLSVVERIKGTFLHSEFITELKWYFELGYIDTYWLCIKLGGRLIVRFVTVFNLDSLLT